MFVALGDIAKIKKPPKRIINKENLSILRTISVFTINKIMSYLARLLFIPQRSKIPAVNPYIIMLIYVTHAAS